MSCLIGKTNCEGCEYQKEGLCDYPYIGAKVVPAEMRSALIAAAAFLRRFEQVREDIVSGKITFYNPPPEWTEEHLNITAVNCTLSKIREESGWN